MKTLNLEEAAQFLKMTPEGTRRKAVAGEIPAAKPGKRWCFCEDDLAEYLRSLYPTTAKTLQGVKADRRNNLWHSTKEVISGGSKLAIMEESYNKLLGLLTK